jgi:hypothetical protein
MKTNSTEGAKNATIDGALSGRHERILGVLVCGALLCAHAAQAFTNEFWVSAMPNTNPTPAGTIADPYDGSTQVKFDSVMGSMPSNCTVHLLGGTYMTAGHLQVQVKSGQKILGSGMDITTLKLTNMTSGASVLGMYNTVGTGIEISDLTCDANAQNNLTNTGYGGIWVIGPNNKVRRVKVVNLAASSTAETFGILASGTYGVSCDGVVIEDCVVMPPLAGAVCSSIVIYAATNAYISARISGNTVYGTNITSVVAFNVCNALNTLLIGNHAIGTGTGVYSDSGGNTNLMVVNNTFNNVQTGVDLGGVNQVHSHLIFSGNIIELGYVPTNWVYGFLFNSVATHTNVIIAGNTIKTYATAGPYLNVVDAPTVSGLTVVNNAIDSRCSWYLAGASGVNLHDNVDLFGNFLSTTNQIGLPNSLTRTTVSGSSYNAQYSDRYIGVQTAGGATIDLPSPTGQPGKEFVIANETSSGTITVSASPAAINGSSSISFSGGYSSKTVISDGRNWFAR